MVTRYILAAAVAAALLLSTSPAAAAGLPQGPSSLTSAQSDLQALVNQYRSSNGLQTVSLNGALSNAATWMANDMATKNYFSHTSLDGRSPAQRMAGAGYPASSSYTGEDLAAGFAGAAQVMSGWIASPAHNAVLLNPNYDAIGIGLGYSATSTYKWYWAADFAGQGVHAAPAPVVAPRPAAVVAAPVVAPRPAVVAAPAPARAPAPAAADADPGLPSTAADPAIEAAALAQAAAVKRHEDRLVKQMTRLLGVLDSRVDDPRSAAAAAARHDDLLVKQMTRLLVHLERRTGF